MSSNNLRIIYNNVVDVSNTTITVSSTQTSATASANLKLDTKSKVWRSATVSGTVTGALANIVLNFASPDETIGGVIFPFCNLSSTATIRVRGYTGNPPTLGGTVDAPTVTTPGTTVFDTGAILSCPYAVDYIWDYGDLPLGANTYAYGGGTYARVWIPTNIQAFCSSISIEIVDTGNNSNYIEMSRLIIGPYWAPTHNLPFGHGVTKKDLSNHSRMESGDLRTTRGPRFNTMSFDLKWLRPADRPKFNAILNNNGMPKPLFVSLFPNNSEDWVKEQSNQIYGKLSNISPVTHPVFEIYSTQIDIEEV